MSEGSREQLMKRAEESDEDSAERLQAVKRRKTEDKHAEDDKKYPKKKVVLLMAYSGKGYYGMQVHTAAGFSLHTLHFLHLAEFKRVLCFREILEPLSSGPSKTIWSPR